MDENKRQRFWHKLTSDCEKCGKDLTLHSMCFASDGQFLVEWVCVHCAKRYHRTYTIAECICTAFEADLEVSFFRAGSAA